MFYEFIFLLFISPVSPLSQNLPATGVARAILSSPPSPTSEVMQVGGGAGAGNGLPMLEAADSRWSFVRGSPPPPTSKPFHTRKTSLPASKSTDTYDVAVMGSTLGLIYALRLQSQGRRVAVLERGKIKGREQEWNIGTGEFKHLQRVLGLDLSDAVGSEFENNRVGFGGFECRVKGVLDLGIKPDVMTEIIREEFERLGGACLEDKSVWGLVEGPDAVAVIGGDDEGEGKN